MTGQTVGKLGTLGTGGGADGCQVVVVFAGSTSGGRSWAGITVRISTGLNAEATCLGIASHTALAGIYVIRGASGAKLDIALEAKAGRILSG